MKYLSIKEIKNNIWDIVVIIVSMLFIFFLSMERIENILLTVTEKNIWLSSKLQFLFERKINLIPLLIIPIVFLIQLIIKNIISQYEDRILLSIPLVLFSSFLLSNIIVLLCENFWGIGTLWDLGDFCDIETIKGYTTSKLYGTNYPPIATLIFYFVGKIVNVKNTETLTYELNYLSFLFLFLVFFSVFFLCEKVLYEKKYSKIISISLIISYPMIFAFERANIILFSLILSFVFVNNYNSEKYLMRIFSIICLALAVNIKIYPLVFLWLLVKEKRYKDMIFAIFMSLFFFLFPAVLLKVFAGESIIENIRLYINSISQFSVSMQVYTVSLRDITKRVIYYFFGGVATSNNVNILSNTVLLLYMVWSFILLFLSKRQSDTLLILSLMIIFVPSVSFWYSLVFLIIPFTYFIKETISEKSSDYWLLSIYILLFILPYRNIFIENNTFVRLILLLVLVSYRVINENKKERKKASIC